MWNVGVSRRASCFMVVSLQGKGRVPRDNNQQ